MKFFTCISVVVLLFLTSCNCIEGNKELVVESRTLPALNGVKFCVDADFEIVQSDSNYFTVESPKDILSHLFFRMDNGTFEVLSDRCISCNDLKITVYAQEMNKICAKSGARIKSLDSLTSDGVFDIDLKEDAYIDLCVNSELVRVNESGAGVLVLKGYADSLEIIATGAGEMEGYGLHVDKIDIQSTGSTAFYVNPIELMDLQIADQTSVYYKGDPHINSAVDGVGNITKMD